MLIHKINQIKRPFKWIILQHGEFGKTMNKPKIPIEKFFSTYSKPLRGYLKSYRIQEADIDDLTSEIWTQIIEKQSEYDSDKAGFYTWLMTLARFKVLEYFKKQKRRPVSIEPDEGRKIKPASKGFNDIIQEAKHKLWAYNELFRLTFLCGGYPHEQLAFGFSKLILGTVGERGVEGRAIEAQNAYGKIKIENAIERFAIEYTEKSHCEDDHVDIAMFPVRNRSEMAVGQLIKKPEEYIQGILQRYVKETALNDYINPESERKNHPFTDWSNRVPNNIRRILKLDINTNQDKKGLDQFVEELAFKNKGKSIKPQGCNRCKLRNFPPCKVD